MKCTGSGTVNRAELFSGMRIVGTVNLRYVMEETDFMQIKDKAVTLSYSIDGTVMSKSYIINNNTVVDLNLANCTLNWLKLETGTVATPFTPRPYVEDLALCRRYTFLLEQYLILTVALISSDVIDFSLPLLNEMRVFPRIINAHNIKIIEDYNGNWEWVSIAMSPGMLRLRAQKNNHGLVKQLWKLSVKQYLTRNYSTRH